MNKQVKLAVAGAVLALGSTAANAGIIIPAGDWTLDIGGIVNAYYTHTTYSGDNLAGTAPLNLGTGGQDNTNNITTGLLPNYLSVSGKTRQNDLDVGFTISINPGASTTRSLVQGEGSGQGGQENRQAFLTLGDKSWGSIKVGKDLGIFASDAILNDMTLLGVGAGAGNLAGNTTTLGRIGTGYMYADWKSQIAYTSPNWNGFSFTAGVTQAFDAVTEPALGGVSSNRRGGNTPAFEAKASYEWAGDFAGKAWVSGISQKVEGLGTPATLTTLVPAGTVGSTPTADPTTSLLPGAAATSFDDERVWAWDIGTTVNVAGFGLTGYYYQGEGIGQTGQLRGGFDVNGNRRDSDGWYTQATYVLPGVGTKLGLSYGESTLEGNSGETLDEVEDSMWAIGAYHPVTKHLNLVAEYSVTERELYRNGAADLEGKSKTISLGAILFF